LIDRHVKIQGRLARLRKCIEVKCEAVDGDLQLFAIEVVIQLVGGGKLAARNRFELGEALPQMRVAAFNRSGRIIGPAIVFAGIAEDCCVFGIFADPVFPVGREKIGKAARRRAGRRRNSRDCARPKEVAVSRSTRAAVIAEIRRFMALSG
jgi:hypothetical protein